MIIEYDEKYAEDVKDLMVELEEYIVAIDKDELDQVGKDYREEYIKIMLKEVEENNGKVYIAVEDGKAVGLVAGIMRTYTSEDYLDYKCPAAGRVTELVTTQKERSKGLGKELLKTMEKYLVSKGAKYIYLDVFSYNEHAKEFYDRQGYHERMRTLIKKVD